MNTRPSWRLHWARVYSREPQASPSLTRAARQDAEIEAGAFVTTKASRAPFTPDVIRATCEKSLGNLQMESIPLYQLHRYDNGPSAHNL